MAIQNCQCNLLCRAVQVCGDTGDDDAEVDLDYRPADDSVAIYISFEVGNGEDANDLDYGYKEAESEHAGNGNLGFWSSQRWNRWKNGWDGEGGDSEERSEGDVGAGSG